MLEEGDADAQAAGFYAAAYSVISGDLAGKTMISVRGADNSSDDDEFGGRDIASMAGLATGA